MHTVVITSSVYIPNSCNNLLTGYKVILTELSVFGYFEVAVAAVAAAVDVETLVLALSSL